MAFLDETGLSYLWMKIKNYIDDKLSAGSGGSYTKVSVTFDGLMWDSQSDGSYVQTLTVSGVTATNDILVAPISTHADVYEEMGCSAIAQADNSVTFRCYDPQDVNVTVDIIILNGGN